MLIAKDKSMLKAEKKTEPDKVVRYRKPTKEQLDQFNQDFNDGIKQFLANSEDNAKEFLGQFITHMAESAKHILTDIFKTNTKATLDIQRSLESN